MQGLVSILVCSLTNFSALQSLNTSAHRYLEECVCACTHVCMVMLSCVPLFATPWTVAHQAPLPVEFSKREYWRGLPFPPLFPTQRCNLGLLCLLHCKRIPLQCRRPWFDSWFGKILWRRERLPTPVWDRKELGTTFTKHHI